jgi:hypothetical protein
VEDGTRARELFILQSIASSSILIHGEVGLDQAGDQTRAPAKPCESGVYEGGRACDLPHA